MFSLCLSAFIRVHSRPFAVLSSLLGASMPKLTNPAAPQVAPVPQVSTVVETRTTVSA